MYNSSILVPLGVSLFVAGNLYMFQSLSPGMTNLEAIQLLSHSLPILLFHYTLPFITSNRTDVHLSSCIGFLLLLGEKDNLVSLPAIYKLHLPLFFHALDTLLTPWCATTPSVLRLFLYFNKGILCFTFCKYGLYDFFQDTIVSTESSFPLICHVMFLFQMYWGFLFMKKLCKPFMKDTLDRFMSEYICHQWVICIMTVNLLLNTWTYYPFQSVRYFLDWVAFATLAIASNNYHTKFCSMLVRDRQVNYTSLEIIPYFLGDITCIHLRGWFASYTNRWYHAPQNNYLLFLLSGLFHLSAFIAAVYDLYQRKDQKLLADSRQETVSFVRYQHLLTCIPCFGDILLVCFHTSACIYSVVGLYSVLGMAIILSVQPWYDLSHILFHVFLIGMTYCMAQCNLYAVGNHL